MRKMKTQPAKKWISLGIGYLLASLVPAVALALITPLRAGQFTTWQLGLVPVFFVFSAMAIALIGMPMYFMLRAMRLVTWWSALIAGCLGGVLVGLIIRLPEAPSMGDLLVTCPVGATSA